MHSWIETDSPIFVFHNLIVSKYLKIKISCTMGIEDHFRLQITFTFTITGRLSMMSNIFWEFFYNRK
jgi:hypothetical protein